MKNSSKIKKLLLPTLALFFVLCLALAFVPQMLNAKAQDGTTFLMGAGAEIRQSDEVIGEKNTSGIRFRASISRAEFDALIDDGNGGTLGYTFGMLIGKGEFTDSASAKATLIANKDDPTVKHQATYFDLTDTEFKYSVAIYNVLDVEKQFAAVGYIEVEGKEPVYADVATDGDNIRSLYDVALKYQVAIHNGDVAPEKVVEKQLNYAKSIVTAVYTAQDFLTIRENPYGNFALMNDIEIKLNGVGSAKDGSDAGTVENNNEVYLMRDFYGKIEGNGHKITVINTDSFSVDATADVIYRGLFREIKAGAIIRNTVFDLTVAGYDVKDNGSCTFAGYLMGTVENCLFISNFGSATGGAKKDSARSILYSVEEGGVLKNAIFNAKGESFSALYRQKTTASNCFYISSYDYLSWQDNGAGNNCKKITSNKEILTDTTIIGTEGCNFTVDGVFIKLLDKAVIDTSAIEWIDIDSAQDFLSIKNDTDGYYRLLKDITITVNGVNTIKEGSDACVTNVNGDYVIMKEFSGTLDGQGHKITIINTDSFSDDNNGNALVFRGIWREIYAGAVIKNTVFDISIASYKTSKNDSAAFVGYISGTVENCLFNTNFGVLEGSSVRSIIYSVENGGILKNSILYANSMLALYRQNALATNCLYNCSGSSYFSWNDNKNGTDCKKVTSYADILNDTTIVVGQTGSNFTVDNGVLKLCNQDVFNSEGVM